MLVQEGGTVLLKLLVLNDKEIQSNVRALCRSILDTISLYPC